MSEVNANRVISEDFSKGLKEDRLKELTNLVKTDTDLLMCFRGNYITIYYRGHSIFKIEEQRRDYKISFDFNHARFTRDWKEKWIKKLELKETIIQMADDIDARNHLVR